MPQKLVMRIICPTCSSHYEIESDKIAARGQLVRCAQCREVWLVRAPEDAAPAGPAQVPPAPTAPEAEEAPIPPKRTGSLLRVTRGAVTRPAVDPIDFQAARVRLRARKDRADETHRRGPAGAITIGSVVLSTLFCLYGFRGMITAHVPAAGTAYAALGLPVNDDGLVLRNVHSQLVAEGNETVLTLQGQIANLRNRRTAVPSLTLVVRGDTNVPLYTWTTPAPKAKLDAGETVAFRSRLAAPPSAGRDVQVSFADAREGARVATP